MIQIVDFYVDEPACLGVPPYLSPYCRYVAGVLVNAGLSTEKISYLTVDQWRAAGQELIDEPELVILIGGSTVPGKYLGGKIGTVADILTFLDYRRKFQKGTTTLIGGPIRHAPQKILDNLREYGGTVVMGDLEPAVEKMISHPAGIRKAALEFQADPEMVSFRRLDRSFEKVNRWAVAGAFLTTLHPNFPYLMLELETYRGCTRKNHCSFCSEVFYGRPVFRSVEGILDEVQELYGLGNRYFRLGRQADLLTYNADLGDYQSGFPRPRPAALEQLYSGIRKIAPDPKVLHLDNINPGAIVAFEKEAADIIKIISDYNTPGDTAAMGLESADPAVCRINDLKCTPDEALRAIEIVNRYGGKRENGIPKLLPGLNFIHGLPGETDRTFELNYRFLQSVQEKELLLRRINIRQITVHPKTKAEKLKADPGLLRGTGVSKKHRSPSLLKKKFIYYRDKIRQEVDRPMLAAVFPAGTVLREVIPETRNPGFILGRQLGSYPVTVKIPVSDPVAMAAFENHQPLDVIVTGYRERSLLGLTYPISINRLGQIALAQIPGVGAKRATRILLARPLLTLEALLQITETLPFGDEKSFRFNIRPAKGIMIQNTHESAPGAKCFVRNASGKRPVFDRFES